MNQLTRPYLGLPAFSAVPPTSAAAIAPDLAQTRFALRVTAALSRQSTELDDDIGERLRFAREQALERARARRTVAATGVTAVGVTRGGAAVLGSIGNGWGPRVAWVLPVLALVTGLIAIDRWQDAVQSSAAAEVDAALLADDLPPTAYSDAGFAEFLKSSGE